MAKMMLLMFCPKLFYKLELAFVPQETTNFFANMIRTSIKSRKESKAKMNDFIDFLTDLAKNVEKVDNEDFESDFEKDAKFQNTFMALTIGGEGLVCQAWAYLILQLLTQFKGPGKYIHID